MCEVSFDSGVLFVSGQFRALGFEDLAGKPHH